MHHEAQVVVIGGIVSGCEWAAWHAGRRSSTLALGRSAPVHLLLGANSMQHSSADGHANTSSTVPELPSVASLRGLLPNESIAAAAVPPWATPLSAADLLGLVNACSVLCAVGSGLVSSHVGDAVGYSCSYLHNAVYATTGLIGSWAQQKIQQQQQRQATNRDRQGAASRVALTAMDNSQSPILPLPLASQLIAACSDTTSREFAVGRQLSSAICPSAALSTSFQDGDPHRLSLEQTQAGMRHFISALSNKEPLEAESVPPPNGENSVEWASQISYGQHFFSALAGGLAGEYHLKQIVEAVVAMPNLRESFHNILVEPDPERVAFMKEISALQEEAIQHGRTERLKEQETAFRNKWDRRRAPMVISDDPPPVNLGM